MNAAPFPSTASRSGRRGFTLIEMMMALAVFVLLASAVFGLMTGVLQSTSTLQDNQDRRDVVDALTAFLKKQLNEMSAQAGVTSYIRGDGDGLKQDGVIFGTASQASAIDARLQPNGYYLLRITSYAAESVNGQSVDARNTLANLVSGDDPSLTWKTLIGDIKTLSWKFQDANATDWSDTWSATGKPAFIEFSMLPAGDLKAVTMDFWLPKIDPITLNIPTAAPTTNAP